MVSSSVNYCDVIVSSDPYHSCRRCATDIRFYGWLRCILSISKGIRKAQAKAGWRVNWPGRCDACAARRCDSLEGLYADDRNGRCIMDRYHAPLSILCRHRMYRRAFTPYCYPDYHRRRKAYDPIFSRHDCWNMDYDVSLAVNRYQSLEIITIVLFEIFILVSLNQ